MEPTIGSNKGKGEQRTEIGDYIDYKTFEPHSTKELISWEHVDCIPAEAGTLGACIFM